MTAIVVGGQNFKDVKEYVLRTHGDESEESEPYIDIHT
jgi:hypothetical protein